MSTENGSCDILNELLTRLGDAPSAEEEAGLRQHVSECPSCRAELLGKSRLARLLRSAPFAETSDDRHLSDLELAAFAADPAGAQDRDGVTAHLAGCPRCRHALVIIAHDLQTHSSGAADGGAEFTTTPPKVFVHPSRLALGRQGIWHAAAAALVWALQWACFGFAAIQLIATYARNAALPGGRRATELPGLVSHPDWRLWILVAGLVCLGIGFRLLAAQLRAPAPKTPEDPE